MSYDHRHGREFDAHDRRVTAAMDRAAARQKRAKPAKYLVNCTSYNGHKDVKFMMEADDFRLRDGFNIGDERWEVVDHECRWERNPHGSAIGYLRTQSHGDYHVFVDWSARKVGK